MQVRGQTYKDIIAGGEYSFEVRLSVVTSESPLTVRIFGMDELFSMSSDVKAFVEEPEIGGVYSATMEFSLLGDGAEIPRMARCTPQFRVTDGTDYSNWLNKGTFYIDSRTVSESPGGITVFNAFCYDVMSLANKLYNNSTLIWPAKDTDILQEICGLLGVIRDVRYGDYIDQGYMLGEPEGEATIRDYLSYIGVMYGGCWIMSDAGLLQFIPMDPAGMSPDPVTITEEMVTTVESSPGLARFTGVKVYTSEDKYIFSGTDETNCLEAYCPFATQEIVDRLYSIADQIYYKSFTASGVWADPAVEIGDQIDTQMTAMFSGRVYSRKITFNQGMTMELSAPGSKDVDHEFYYTPPETDRTETAIGGLTSAVENLGVRNLIINTKNPDASQQANWPRLYEQLDNTRNSGWTASAAEHGIRMTKGSSTQTTLALQMGGTSPGSSTASMNGLTAGQTYTMAYGFKYLVLPEDTDTTYARWRLIYYTENISGASARSQLLNRVTVRRDTETFQNVKFTFTVPEDAVVCALYFNFCDSTDTNIPNATFRSTDYFEFSNMILTEGYVAPNWIPAPEDGVADTSETVATSGTAETFDLPTSGVYLLTVNRMNSTSTTYDGAWLVSVGTSSHVFQLANGSNGPTPSVSGHTLSVTTSSANQRITITKLG